MRGCQAVSTEAEFPRSRSPAAVVKQIKNTGLTGVLSVFAANGRYGSGKKKGRVILIMQKPVNEAIELREPDATSIVYVQSGDQWQMFPSDAPTLKRTIRLEPEANDHNQTSVMVELATGARQGFGVGWPELEKTDK
jgi:hypothetical protein